MRSDWVKKEDVEHVLAALSPQNRLACELSLATGMRIGDVLELKVAKFEGSNRFTYKEQKTGKVRAVTVPRKLYADILRNAGKIYVFEGRSSAKKHRTRQAVFKDIKRVASFWGGFGGVNLTPHSLRKSYAVDELGKDGDLKRVQKLLNHSNEAVTMIYALANHTKKSKRK